MIRKETKAVKGFTLIELLIVIGIIAVLAVVVLLTLNPAELLRQARDSNRLSDLGTLKSALALYSTDVSQNFSIGANSACFVTILTGTTLPTGIAAGTTCGGRFGSPAVATPGQFAAGVLRNTDGTGWIPVNFGQISSGSPISALPVDPSNTATTASSTSYFYAYRASQTGVANCAASACTEYELNAHMESSKFKNGGGSNVESTDGGNDSDLFEMGTDPGLDI